MRRVPLAEMATIVQRVETHSCMRIIATDLDGVDVDVNDLEIGTVVRCRKSCGRFYQRHGDGSSSGSPLWREVENRGTNLLPNWQPVHIPPVEREDVVALADEYVRARAERGRET